MSKTKQDEWKMPVPSLGPALFYRSSDSPAVAAMITEVGDNFVTLAIYPPENRSFLVQDAVRHVDDPALAKFPMYENGTWDFTNSYYDWLALLKDTTTLHSSLEGVKKELAQLKTALGEKK